MTVQNETRDVGPPDVAPDAGDGPAVPPAEFRGYVDLYGYHTLAGGWFFAGWLTRRDGLAQALAGAVARFGAEANGEPVASLFFAREDISDQGIGFLIFFRAPRATDAPFSRLQIEIDGAPQNIVPVEQAVWLPESALIRRLKFIVSLSEESFRRREMELLLDGHPDATGHGYIEYFGYHEAAGGWFLSGWISRGWSGRQAPDRWVIAFEQGDLRGEMIATTFARPELPAGAEGVVLFLRAGPAPLGTLCAVSLHAGGVRSVLAPIIAAPHLDEAELAARLTANLELARPGLARDRLTNLAARAPFRGEDTMEAFAPGVFIYVDETILCGDDGLVLMGWILAKPGEVREIRVRSGARSTTLRLRDCIRIERHDVLDGFAKFGFDQANSGFIAYLPGAAEPERPIYIEVETERCEAGFRNVPRPAHTGLAAIKRLLDIVDLRFDDLRHGFDKVLGPAVDALNRARLASPVGTQIIEFGEVPKAPRFSVIVPVHGRLDFAEYQLALFSARPEAAAVEFVYVLDDPPKRREAQMLFASIYERFLIPFRVLVLDRNVGYAPANNIGLRHAHGEFVAFLNSDVFPGTADWLEQLSARLVADPQLGVVGPLLLFEDGSVQHRGMYFERLPEYGDWFFCQHHDKGLRYTGGDELQTVIAITGACMVMRRDLADRFGGFDEMFVIGDFEDSDLCLKLRAQGFSAGVDPAVRLFHLERKSQPSSSLRWRANLTAFNAWAHGQRWSETIAAAQAPGDRGQAFGRRP